MTFDDEAPQSREGNEPGEIEALLPWYAVGTLRRRDRKRVEEALRGDPALALQAELAREELAETIQLNETLGAPSAQAMDRLMAAIDAEAHAASRRRPALAFAGWLMGVIQNFSPRTLALAASAIVLAVGLQAIALVDMLVKPSSPELVGASEEPRHHGMFAMVRFTREANAAEITDFLQTYQATVVDGPKPGGLYRIKIAVASLAKEEFGRIVARMRHERIVEVAVASE